VFSFVSINKKYNKGWPESVTQANHFFMPFLVFRFNNNSEKGNCTNNTNIIMSANCVVADEY